MIGEALRLLRVFNDLTLLELSDALDVHVSFLSEVENEKRKPSLELIDKYARFFKIRPSAIMFFSEEIDKSSIKGKAKGKVQEKMIKLLRAVEHYGNGGDDHVSSK